MATDILGRMRRNPASDWNMRNVEKVCGQNGLECEPPTGGGSHWKVFALAVPGSLTIPAHRPIKPVYIRKLVKFIDERK